MAKTVRDLIKDLEELDPNLVVGISSDSEGNAYYPWSGDYSLAIHQPEAGYGEEFIHYIEDEYDEDEYDEGEYRAITEDEATAIILWV